MLWYGIPITLKRKAFAIDVGYHYCWIVAVGKEAVALIAILKNLSFSFQPLWAAGSAVLPISASELSELAITFSVVEILSHAKVTA